MHIYIYIYIYISISISISISHVDRQAYGQFFCSLEISYLMGKNLIKSTLEINKKGSTKFKSD